MAERQLVWLGFRGARYGIGALGGVQGGRHGIGGLAGVQRVQAGCSRPGWDARGTGRVQEGWLGCRWFGWGAGTLLGVQGTKAEYGASWQRCSRSFLGFRCARQGAERLSRIQRGSLGCRGV